MGNPDCGISRFWGSRLWGIQLVGTRGYRLNCGDPDCGDPDCGGYRLWGVSRLWADLVIAHLVHMRQYNEIIPVLSVGVMLYTVRDPIILLSSSRAFV